MDSWGEPPSFDIITGALANPFSSAERRLSTKWKMDKITKNKGNDVL